MSAASDLLVRSRHIGRLALPDERTFLTHVLGRTRVVADQRVVRLLDGFALPRAATVDLESVGIPVDELPAVLHQLRATNLLRPAGNGEARRIRHVYSQRLRRDTRVVPPPAPAHGDRRVDLVAGDTILGRSPALATIRLEDGEYLVTHPVGRPLHLTKTLWDLVEAFAEPVSVDAAYERLAAPTTSLSEFLVACDFLVRRRLLWRSAGEEQAEAARMLVDTSPNRPLHVLHPAVERWSQRFVAYDLPALRPPVATARIALVGACQIQVVGEALEHLGQQAGWDLHVHGVLAPGDELARSAWDLVVLPAGQFCASFYEAVAAEDVSRCRRFVPAVLAQVDAAVDRIRVVTDAPLLVLSVTPPGLSATQPTSPFAAAMHALIADLNQRITGVVNGSGRGWLLDEQSLIASGSTGAYWDDEFNALPHHSALGNWSWVPLKSGVTDDPLDEEALADSVPPVPADQSDPAAVLAAGLLHVLARARAAPVRLVVFEPNGLLWPGRLEDRATAYTSPPHFFADIEEHVHAGIHEALSLLRRRGVLLACWSTCPPVMLRERWRIESPARHVVRHDDLAAAAEATDDGLRQLLRACGVSDAEAVVICPGGVLPPWFRGRRHEGDRWGVRRFLLTDPGLHPLEPPFGAASRPSARARMADETEPDRLAGTDAVDDETTLADVDAVVASVLACDLRTITGDDLRPLGLDSLGAVEALMRLEHHFDITFEDHDFAEPVAFFRSGMRDAVVRGLQRRRRTEAGHSSDPGAGPPYRGLTYDDWCARDLASVIREHAHESSSPWQFKFLRSGAPHEYEYVSWRQLVERALGHAASLETAGARPGDCVAIVASQGSELVAAFTGAVLGGYVPSVTGLPNERQSPRAFGDTLRQVLARSRARAIVGEPASEAVLAKAVADLGVDVQLLVEPPPPVALHEFDPPRPRPEDVALLQHSSGTTGRKKGVVLRHRDLLAQAWNLGRALHLDGADRIVSWLPMYHDMGLICCTVLPLVCAVPTTVMSPHDWVRQPHLLLQQVSEERATLSWTPTFALAHCARRTSERHLADLDLSSLRALVVGAEPVTVAAFEAFHRRFAPYGLRRSALTAGYGLAEAVAGVTQTPPGRSARRTGLIADDLRRARRARLAPPCLTDDAMVELVSCGPVVHHVDVEVVDPTGRPCAAGEVGEIRIGGDCIATGYVDDEAATARVFRDGWCYPGDEGFFLDGELYVTGRLDDVIIVAGTNIQPHDVESAVSAVEGVHPGRVVAFGVHHETDATQRLVVMLETTVEDPAARAELARQVRDAVFAACGVAVHDVAVHDERVLVKSTSGKLSRARNRELYLADRQ